MLDCSGWPPLPAARSLSVLACPGLVQPVARCCQPAARPGPAGPAHLPAGARWWRQAAEPTEASWKPVAGSALRWAAHSGSAARRLQEPAARHQLAAPPPPGRPGSAVLAVLLEAAPARPVPAQRAAPQARWEVGALPLSVRLEAGAAQLLAPVVQQEKAALPLSARLEAAVALQLGSAQRQWLAALLGSALTPLPSEQPLLEHAQPGPAAAADVDVSAHAAPLPPGCLTECPQPEAPCSMQQRSRAECVQPAHRRQAVHAPQDMLVGSGHRQWHGQQLPAASGRAGSGVLYTAQLTRPAAPKTQTSLSEEPAHQLSLASAAVPQGPAGAQMVHLAPGLSWQPPALLGSALLAEQTLTQV